MWPRLRSLTAVHATAGKATFLHVAVQFQVLKLKLALIPDLSVVRGVAPAVPTHAGEQVLVWYTAVVGGTRGWKLVPFPTGLNEEFTVFAHKCTFPAHVSWKEGAVSKGTATLPSPPLPSPPLQAFVKNYMYKPNSWLTHIVTFLAVFSMSTAAIFFWRNVLSETAYIGRLTQGRSSE